MLDRIKRLAYAVYETDKEITLRVLNHNPYTEEIKTLLRGSDLNYEITPNPKSAQTHFIVIKL